MTTRPRRPRRLRWRPWLRALHRDIGYLAVGLTVVYALSGLAVNHIGDWDPNFDNYEHTHQGQRDWQRNGTPLEEEGYSTDLIAGEAMHAPDANRLSLHEAVSNLRGERK